MTMRYTRLGDQDVPVYQFDWKAGERQPYRKTYSLVPGQSWWDAEITDKQFENYAFDDDGNQIPVGALIARQLVKEGAKFAVFTEMWARKFVMVDQDLNCVSPSSQAEEVLVKIKAANDNKLGGFPDVFAIHPDGKLSFREAKSIKAKDRVGPKQHEFANLLRSLFGSKVDLGVVEWDLPGVT